MLVHQVASLKTGYSILSCLILMRGITNVDTRQVALPVLWLYGSAISPARLFK